MKKVMSTLIIEKAKLKNLKDLIYLLFEDDLGKERENLRNIFINKYKKAFTKIIKDSNNEICIMTLNDQIIYNEIEKINKNLSKIEKIKKFFVINEQFTIENGLMTPTLKLKRFKIIQKYKNEFEKLY